MISEKEVCWYVLQAKFNRALLAQESLSKMGLDTFVPMEMRTVRTKGGKVQRKLVPVFMNLIFVKSSLVLLKEIKETLKYLYYVSYNVDNFLRPMVVPTEEMEQFISFVEGKNEHIEYIDHEGLDLKKGESVRIKSGIFEGKEATFMKIKGKRSKQIVVAIQGVIAVVLTTVDQDMIEKLS